MGLLLIFIAGFIVMIVAIFAIVGFVSDRVSRQTHFKQQIHSLEQRIEQLEMEKYNRSE